MDEEALQSYCLYINSLIVVGYDPSEHIKYFIRDYPACLSLGDLIGYYKICFTVNLFSTSEKKNVLDNKNCINDERGMSNRSGMRDRNSVNDRNSIVTL